MYSQLNFNAEISNLQIWCIMQDEEKNRNSVMLDMLYTHCTHPLSAQIFSYYQVASQLPPHARTCWVIDTNARLVWFHHIFNKIPDNLPLYVLTLLLDPFVAFILQRWDEWISLVV